MKKPHKAKFDPSVAWLEPFFRAAEGLVSRKLTAIKGYTVPLSKEHRCDAQITAYTEGRRKWFVIALATHLHKVQGGYKMQSVKVSGYLLRDFAHELAHTKHFEHTVEHFALQCKIERRFVKVLKRFEITNTDVRRPLKAAKRKKRR